MAEENAGICRSNVSTTEGAWSKWKTYEHIIVSKVRAVDIVRRMPDIPDEIKGEIERLEKTTSLQAASRKLLNFFAERKNAKDWEKFLEILEAEYPYVYDVLKTGRPVDDDRHRQTIRQYYTSLLEVNPKDVIDHCYQEKLVNQEDKQEIENECSNHSTNSGMSVLLDRIERRAEDWFFKFLEILFINKYDFKVKEIESYMYEVLCNGLSGEKFIKRCNLIERERYSGMETDDDDVNEKIQNRKRRISQESESQDGNGAGLKCKTAEEIPHKVQKTEDNENHNKMEELTLRNYQDELAEFGLKGMNDLIVANTGSGKTHVAMKIIQAHIDKHGDKGKVAFVVDKTALAKQQFRQIIKYVDRNARVITGDTQRGENANTVSEWIQNADILVMTAQILVNALATENIKVSDFTLLVFDECHHATQNHPYNQIMHHYMEVKLSVENPLPLPQIIGLTASVGVGKAKSLESAVKRIETLIANLDAKHISTVLNHTEELNRFSIYPNVEMYYVSGRENVLFKDVIHQIMNQIVQYIKETSHIRNYSGIRETLEKSVEKGTESYTQWLRKLEKQISETSDSNARKCLTTCYYFLEVLEVYQRSLMVYADARVKDAMVFLKQKFKEWNENSILDETSGRLKDIYDGFKQTLEDCITDPTQENPKLIKLQDILLKDYEECGDMRAIVFVKTKSLASHLESWMNETPALKRFSPSKFVGIQQNSKDDGLTKCDQEIILDFFRKGGYKLIIATSVAEEGLDIPECNRVIRYDHVTNETSMTQSRGRCRAKDGIYTVIAGEEGNTANKEKINNDRELLSKQAIRRIQDAIASDYESFLTNQCNIQKSTQAERDSEEVNNDNQSLIEKTLTTTCFRCRQELCMSSDFRKIKGHHHAVVNPDIDDKILVIEEEGYDFGNFKFVSKISCRDCLMELGKECTYNDAKYPVLSAKSISFEDSSSGRVYHFKQWKQLKGLFIIPNLEKEEL